MTEGLEQKARENFKKKPIGYESKRELDIYTDGYIEGATENGVKWHKVADGDLPKNKGLFLFRDKYEKENRYINYGITDDKDMVKDFDEWVELSRHYEGE